MKEQYYRADRDGLRTSGIVATHERAPQNSRCILASDRPTLIERNDGWIAHERLARQMFSAHLNMGSQGAERRDGTRGAVQEQSVMDAMPRSHSCGVGPANIPRGRSRYAERTRIEVWVG